MDNGIRHAMVVNAKSVCYVAGISEDLWNLADGSAKPQNMDDIRSVDKAIRPTLAIERRSTEPMLQRRTKTVRSVHHDVDFTELEW